MPHSSGGGSHSGGSHSGSGFSSSSSSSGGSSAKHIKHTSFPGARRYVYYENYRPVYVYADYDIRKGTASGKFFSILGSAVSLLFGIMLLAMCYDKPQKMDTSPSYSCEIVDCAGVIDDADMVQSAIDDFYDETGIPVEVMTVNNEDWQGSYSKLEDFAYDMYVTEFDDEEHWLVVYSEPTSPDPDFNDWYWEGMQGDDTDSIITSSVAYDFTNDLHKRLLVEGTKVNDAITDSFNALTPTVMKFRFEGETFGIGIFMLLFVCIHAFFMVFFRPNANKYKGAKEVPLDGYYAPPQQTAPQPQSVVMKQASCEYCGGVYTIGSCNACPHCGAPIQPQDYTVPVHNGTSTASTTDTTNTNTH